MSVSNSTRSNRPNRDKSGKTQTQSVKDGPAAAKMNKPTADQLRIAQLIEKKPEDYEYNKTVNEIMEMTKKTEEEVVVALYDCDQDKNRTVNLLLEGGGDQGEWQEMGKKRKKNPTQPTQSKPDMGERPERKQNNREKSNDRDVKERSESSGRGRSRMMNDGPPRFQRIGKTWRGKENEENERNRSGRSDRGGNSERGRGRGRGRGGRGGGRGGVHGLMRNAEPNSDDLSGDLNFSSEPNTNGFESAPHIDTWTNDQAKAPKNHSWGDTEDWNDDDWTGNLSESAVFTARSLTAAEETDDKMETKNSPEESFGATNQLPQAIDLSAILNQKPVKEMDLHSQTNLATESLKSMMGIGTSSSPQDFSSLTSMSVAPPMTSGGELSSSPSLAVGSMSQAMMSQGSMPQQSQRAKPARSKMPPPSKIPATPVEMPGHMSMRLDVQFGFGADTSSLSFGESTDTTIASSFTNSSIGTMNSHMNHNGATPEAPTSTVASLSSMVQQQQKAPLASMESSTSATGRQSMFPNSPDTTPSKDYQSSMNKSLMTPAEAYSSQDHKTSPMMTSSHAQNALDANDSSKYSQGSSYSSSYRYQTHKSAGLTPATSAGTSQPNMAKTSSYAKPQSQYQSGFQSSNSFQTNQPASGYGKLGQSFQNTGSSTYRGQSTTGGYRDGQDNSPPGYPSGQPASSYQQKQASQSNSYQTGQLGSYSAGQSSLSGQSTSPSSYSGAKSYGSSDQEFSKAQSSTSASSYAGAQTYSGQSTGRQTEESSFSSSQAAGSTYPSAGGQSVGAYQSNPVVSGASPYSHETAAPLSHPTSQSSQAYGSRSTYGANHPSALQTSPISANKLSDGLSKMSVKDSNLESSAATYSNPESDSAPTTSTLSAPATASASSASLSSVGGSSASASAHLAALTSSAASNVPVAAKTTSVTSSGKAPPNLPPGVPAVMGHNFIMSQPGIAQYFGLQGLTTQQPVYSYEDLQLLQQRLAMPGYYDPNALSFQPPTSMAGRDQNSIGSVPYSVADGGKMNRVDAPSPVQGSQQSSQQQPAQSAHQQPYINATLAPGYGYYYPNAGLLPSGFSYQPTVQFQQVPPVTNTAHGAGTTSSTQFQKPGAYTSHGYGTTYDDLSQAQDFSKSAYPMSQSQNKVSATAGGIKAITTTNSDIPVTGYGKSHSQVRTGMITVSSVLASSKSESQNAYQH